MGVPPFEAFEIIIDLSYSRRGNAMTPITDEQVEAKFASIGVPLENFFVLPIESTGGGLIGFWHPEIGFRLLILEKEDWAKACYAYLLKRGARQFASDEDISKAIYAEKWPRWDTCAAALRHRSEPQERQIELSNSEGFVHAGSVQLSVEASQTAH
jgi:hypothetical protein